MTPYRKTVTKTYDPSGSKATEVYPIGATLSLEYTHNEVNGLTEISDGTTVDGVPHGNSQVGWRG